MYDALLGRFVSRDPIGYEGSEANLSEYVRSRPTISRDAMGLFDDHHWPPGSPGRIDRPEIPMPDPAIGSSLCGILELAVGAVVRGHTATAWRRFTQGIQEPIDLSAADMAQVMAEYGVRERIIDPLVEACRNSNAGWTKSDTKGWNVFAYELQYWYRSPSWAAALGGVSFRYKATCCPRRSLAWTISISDPWDFDNWWRPGMQNIPRNIYTTFVGATNAALGCGWRSFLHRGELSGVERL